MRLTSVYVRPWNSVLNLLKWEENPSVKFNFSSQVFLNPTAIKKCILFLPLTFWGILIQILCCIFTFYFNILFQLWKLNLLPGKHFGSSIFLCHTKYILQIPPNFAHFSQTRERMIYILETKYFISKLIRYIFAVRRWSNLSRSFRQNKPSYSSLNNKTETNPSFKDF